MADRIVVVGGGLAGLAAAMKLAELGISVDLLSLTRSNDRTAFVPKGELTASTI